MIHGLYSICSFGQESLKFVYSRCPPETISKELYVAPHAMVEASFADKTNYSKVKKRAYLSCPELKKRNNELKTRCLDKCERVSVAVEAIAKEYFAELSKEQQQQVLDRAAQICSNENHFEKYRLYAMSMQGLLPDSEPTTFEVWNNEAGLEVKSQYYHTGLFTLERGEVGYINGIERTFQEAKADAFELSDRLCGGKEIVGIYSATHGPVKDEFFAVRGQSGVITPPVELLLRQWSCFFHRNHQDNYLQICHSQGAVLVYHALQLLPEKLRCRICVIAIAPAYFIPRVEGCEVLHFVNRSDIVPCYLSVGKERVREDDPDIITIPQGESIHGPFGDNYDQTISFYVNNYLNLNVLN